MTMDSSFEEIYSKLRAIMLKHANGLVRVKDVPGNLYLDTRHIMKNKKALFFGGVQINKSYVSYHLMPVYVLPALLKGMSPELKRRKQGKSCFNFKAIDKVLFAELDELTRKGRENFRDLRSRFRN